MEPVARQSSGDSQPEKKPTPPKPRSNPFGAARPREEVLKEKERERQMIREGEEPGTSCPMFGVVVVSDG